jgi:phosphatidylglycerol:prolipoprotein diacylglycerol transferase
MLDSLAAIVWTVDPEMFRIGSFAPRWYGLCFALAFMIGYFMVEWMFRYEKLPTKWLDGLLIAMVAGTIIGARLGHVLFYEIDSYLEDPLSILMIWKGGLASHGGLIGITIALLIWSRFVSKKSLLWVMDRMAAPTALGGFFIRMGNLMNHEIVGTPTDLPWGFQFSLYSDQIARHPVQLYESLAYLLIFFFLLHLYKNKHQYKQLGKLTGAFLALIFGARFFLEFFKENQIELEQSMSLNMGHWLSIPVVAIGLYLWLRKSNESHS